MIIWFVNVNKWTWGISWLLDALRPRQNCRHFTDAIFKCIFLHENVWISLKISLKFVPKVRINNIPALVQIMAWRWPGDKSLFEPMIVNLLTHNDAGLNALCSHNSLTRTEAVPPGGALGQVSYGGVQLRGPNPYPILGKAGLRKHTLF